MTHSWKVNVQLMRESTCLYVSVLNIESSYLTSIHFKTSIQWRRERQKKAFFLHCWCWSISHFKYFAFTPGLNSLACSLQAVFGFQSFKSAIDGWVTGRFWTTSFFSRGWWTFVRGSLKIHTGEEPSDQWLSFLENVSHGISPLNVSLSSSESKYGSYYCSHIILLCYLLHTNSLKGTKEEGERGRRRWEVLSRKLFWSKGHKKGQRSTANGILTLLQRCVCAYDRVCECFGVSLYPNTPPREAVGNAGGLEGGLGLFWNSSTAWRGGDLTFTQGGCTT